MKALIVFASSTALLAGCSATTTEMVLVRGGTFEIGNTFERDHTIIGGVHLDRVVENRVGPGPTIPAVEGRAGPTRRRPPRRRSPPAD